MAQLFIGTYTRTLPHVAGKASGIYGLHVDLTTGQFSEPRLLAQTVNPSYLCRHRNLPVLYCVNEGVADDEPDLDSVTVFELTDGELLTAKQQLAAQGAFPCHVTIDNSGKHLVVANYVSGNVASFPIAADGQLSTPQTSQHTGTGPNLVRQEGPHAHGVFFHPQQNLAVAADLGTDNILVYDFSPPISDFRLRIASKTALKPGAGPRHIAWHPGGEFLFVANELDSTVTAFRFSGNELSPIASASTLPTDEFVENACSAIRTDQQGRFVYVANRGHDSISVFEFDASSAALTRRQTISTQGQVPRDFAMSADSTLLVVANQNSDTLWSFHVDPTNGDLSTTKQCAKVPTPVCVLFA